MISLSAAHVTTMVESMMRAKKTVEQLGSLCDQSATQAMVNMKAWTAASEQCAYEEDVLTQAIKATTEILARHRSKG